MRHRSLNAPVLLALLAVAGCNGNKVEPDKGAPDLFGPDILSPFDKGPEQCGEGIYPCAPYGTQTGAVATNMDFLGFRDEDEQCKAHKDKVLNLDGKPTRIAFKDWYLGSQGCAKRGLLWVMTSAGWCVPCMREVCKTAREYQAGSVDARVGVLNIMFETDNKPPIGPADEAFIRQWITNLPDPDNGMKRCLPVGKNLSFPVVMDPSFRMGAYFNKQSVPFNMLIDLSTMKIYFQQVGENLPAVGQAIQNFFK